MKKSLVDPEIERHLTTFKKLVSVSEAELDLAQAAVQIAGIADPDLDPAPSLLKLEQLAETLRPRLSSLPSTLDQAVEVARYLFVECGFTGNTNDYYDVRNSFLNEVLERRLGIPISLSVIFIAVAHRLGLHAEGVGMPGHFLVRHTSADGQVLLDPFHDGKVIHFEDCQRLLAQVYGSSAQMKPEYLRAVTKHQLLGRMLSNLKNIYLNDENWPLMFQVIEMILLVQPEWWTEYRDRGVIHLRLENWSQAVDDLTFYCAKCPEDENFKVLQEYIGQARRALAQWN
ncbi:MAG: tetratricopeptide repeat protein [Acidobacteria bacterium]|nr:tetratricopeptide repeat protein [Acidobacteriota bacterium]